MLWKVAASRREQIRLATAAQAGSGRRGAKRPAGAHAGQVATGRAGAAIGIVKWNRNRGCKLYDNKGELVGRNYTDDKFDAGGATRSLQICLQGAAAARIGASPITTS